MKIWKLLALLVMAGLLHSCKDDDNGPEPQPKATVNFKLDLQHKGSDVHLFDTIALNANSDFYLSLFRIYLSHISAVAEGGNMQELKDVAIFSPGTDSASSFSASIPAGEYQAFDIGFGLDAQQNDADPASFPAGHPMSLEETMYWPMMKYRFVKFEGVLFEDTSYAIAYHPGLDIMYMSKNYSQQFSAAENDEIDVHLILDMGKLLDGPAGLVNYRQIPQWHGDSATMAVAQLFMANLVQSSSLEIR